MKTYWLHVMCMNALLAGIGLGFGLWLVVALNGTCALFSYRQWRRLA